MLLAAEATYQVTFEDLWTRAEHPLNYPRGAHFSPVVGAVHNENISFWSPGELASVGVERVAEVGATSDFVDEAANARQATHASTSHLGSNVNITLTDEFPW